MRKQNLNTRTIIVVALAVMAFNLLIGFLSMGGEFQSEAVSRVAIGALLSGAVVAGLLILYSLFAKRK